MSGRPLGTLSLALTVLAAVALAACSGSENEPANEAPTASVEVTMSEMAFAPDEVTLTSGERIALRLQNDGSMDHDFTVDELPADDVETSGGLEGGEHAAHGGDHALHLGLAPATSGEIEFEPTEAGRYEYYCTVEGHREAGMAGTLIVE